MPGEMGSLPTENDAASAGLRVVAAARAGVVGGVIIVHEASPFPGSATS